MSKEVIEQIRRRFEKGHTLEAAELLLSYVKEQRPDLKSLVTVHLKDLRQHKQAELKNQNPDPGKKSRAEEGLLQVIHSIENPETEAPETPMESFYRRFRDDMGDYLSAAWRLLTRPGVLLVLIIFGVTYHLGSRHAQSVNNQLDEQSFISRLVQQNLRIQMAEDRSSFTMTYSCDGAMRYEYHPAEGLREIPLTMENAAEWMAVAGSAPLESYVVLGSVSWLIASPASFWKFLRTAFASQNGNPQRLVLLVALVSGYAYGYYRNIRKTPACTSPLMQQYLDSEAFWKSLYSMKSAQMQIGIKKKKTLPGINLDKVRIADPEKLIRRE